MFEISFWDIIITGISAGFIGMLAMGLIMFLLTKPNLPDSDIFKVLGQIFVKQADNSRITGIFVHIISGIIFGIVYTYIAATFGTEIGYIGLSMILGVFHGAVITFLLVVVVSEHHPLRRHRKTGYMVPMATFVAHIVYGFIVGLVLNSSLQSI
ncbi:MAG: DUF6789 family protein [Candidatus Kapaibacterium sp.]